MKKVLSLFCLFILGIYGYSQNTHLYPGTSRQSMLVPNNSTYAYPYTTYTYPLPSPLGVIYSDSVININDFVPLNGASTSVVGGVLSVTSPTNSFGPNLYDRPWNYSGYDNWTYSAMTQLTSTITGSTIGYGPEFISSLTGSVNGVLGYIRTNGSPAMFLYTQNGGVQLATGTLHTVNTNDFLLLTMKRLDTMFRYICQNVTQCTIDSISYSFPSNNTSGPFLPETGYWGWLSSGTNFKIYNRYMSSPDTRSPTGVFYSASRADYFPSSFAQRGWNLINSAFPTTVLYANQGDQLAGSFLKMDEIQRFNPEWWFIMDMGLNDYTHGASIPSIIQNMDAVIAKTNNGGQTKIFLGMIPVDTIYRNSLGDHTWDGETNLRNTLKTHYASGFNNVVWIDTIWTGMSTNNILNSSMSASDHIHLNDSGQAHFAHLFINSGYPTTQSISRKDPYSNSSNFVNQVGDQILTPFSVRRQPDFYWKSDAFNNLTTGLLSENDAGTNLTVTASPYITPPTSALAHIYGRLQLDGPLGGLILRDVVSTNTDSFFIQAANNLLEFSNNGVAAMFMNNGGQVRVDNTSGLPFFKSTFSVAGNRTFTAGQGNTGWVFNLDSATQTANISSAGLSELNVANINQQTITNSSGSYAKASALKLEAPIAAGGLAFGGSYALRTLGNIEETGKRFIIQAPATGGSSDSLLVRITATGEERMIAQSSLGGGVTTVGAFSGSSQTNGASISGSTITFGPADITNAGMVKPSGSQTFGPTITFANEPIFPAPTTSNASIRLTGGSANPTSPTTGDLWYNFSTPGMFFQPLGSTAPINLIPSSEDISTTSLTLDNTFSNIMFNGSSAASWTLPAGSTYQTVKYTIKNRGTAIITLSRSSTDVIYYNSSSSVTSILIYPGDLAVIFSTGGGNWAANITGSNGNYTPSITNTTNVASSSAGVCYYTRRDNQVHVWGRVNITATLTATATSFDISLPIASVFTSADDASGQYSNNSAAMLAGGITADAVNAKVSIAYTSINTASEYLPFSFDYIIK